MDLKIRGSCNIIKCNEQQKIKSGTGSISIYHTVTLLMTNLIISFRIVSAFSWNVMGLQK
jgi:hypothetical protein